MEGNMSKEEVFFDWLPEYNVNIKVIDDQHRELVKILNRLFVAVSKREGGKEVAGILDALMGYTQTHFALEEKLLKQAMYGEIEHHKREHRKLIAEFDLLCKQYLAEEKPIYFELLRFLKVWLKEHIQGEDSKYSEALRKAGFSSAEWELEAAAEFERITKSKKWWSLWN
jgi:hemerythrin